MLKFICTRTFLDEAQEMVDEEYIEKILEDDKVITEMDKEIGIIDYTPIKNRVGEEIIYITNGVEQKGKLEDVVLKDETKDGIAKIKISFV